MANTGAGGEPVLILLLGESLLMDSLAVELVDGQNVKVRRIRSAVPYTAHTVFTQDPSLIIFDLDATQCTSLLSCMQLLSDVPVLGLDANSHQVLCLTCKRLPDSTMAQLRSTIDHYVTGG